MIKAKYTQGDNSQEFEFNSMAELLEYERAQKEGQYGKAR